MSPLTWKESLFASRGVYSAIAWLFDPHTHDTQLQCFHSTLASEVPAVKDAKIETVLVHLHNCSNSNINSTLKTQTSTKLTHPSNTGREGSPSVFFRRWGIPLARRLEKVLAGKKVLAGWPTRLRKGAGWLDPPGGKGGGPLWPKKNYWQEHKRENNTVVSVQSIRLTTLVVSENVKNPRF